MDDQVRIHWSDGTEDVINNVEKVRNDSDFLYAKAHERGRIVEHFFSVARIKYYEVVHKNHRKKEG